MSDPTLWWLACGAAIIVELLTGTFYLLMLAFGLGAAALAAHLGVSQTLQILTAAAVGGGSVAAWHFGRERHPKEPPAQANVNVNLDIGETVQIGVWAADGTAQVQYRGANWTAVHRPGIAPVPGAHRVAELVGNRLVVERV